MTRLTRGPRLLDSDPDFNIPEDKGSDAANPHVIAVDTDHLTNPDFASHRESSPHGDHKLATDLDLSINLNFASDIEILDVGRMNKNKFTGALR